MNLNQVTFQVAVLISFGLRSDHPFGCWFGSEFSLFGSGFWFLLSFAGSIQKGSTGLSIMVSEKEIELNFRFLWKATHLPSGFSDTTTSVLLCFSERLTMSLLN